MKKQEVLIVSLSILCIILLGVTAVLGYMLMKEKNDNKTPTNPTQVEEVEKTHEFEIDLFKEGFLASQEDGVYNTVISPLSVKIAMAMVTEGAKEDTLSELREVLELDENSKQEYEDLLDDVSDQEDIVLNIANSVWSKKGLQFKAEFIDILEKYFKAEATSLDFEDPSSVLTINNWVEANTNGKINKIIEKIDPLDIMFLINAIYFNADWSNQFEESMTKEKDFTLVDDSKVKVELMSMSSDFQYQQTDDFQAVQLPYGEDGRFVMRVYLPKEGKDIDKFVEGLSREKLKGWNKDFSEMEGYLELPKFTTEYSKSLKEILMKLGIHDAFNPIIANFNNIFEEAYISQVIHKTYIDVSEKGTEAAAVTAITMEFGSMPTEPKETFEMIVDRPFLFTIDDTKLNEILFMGTILNPTE